MLIIGPIQKNLKKIPDLFLFLCICPIIRIGQEIQCLPYAGFFCTIMHLFIILECVRPFSKTQHFQKLDKQIKFDVQKVNTLAGSVL